MEELYTTYGIVVAWRRDRGHDMLRGISHSYSYNSAEFVGFAPCESKEIIFLICHMTPWSTWLCGWGPFILSHHPVKFGIHRPFESGDISSEICHVTRGRCVTWFFGWGPFILIHHPSKFGVHRPCESGIITFFICHVTRISKCHVILWVVSSHPKSPPC